MTYRSPWLARLQAICLAFPEATQQWTFERDTFRVRAKIFVWVVENQGMDAIVIKGRPGDKEMLMSADPRRFFDTPYLGLRGWFSVRLSDDTDWEEIEDLIDTSYRLVAPKRLSAQLPG